MTTYIETTLGALPTPPPDESILGGDADEYAFRFTANGGSLTLAGAADLAIYDRELNEWEISDTAVGVVPQIVADGSFAPFWFSEPVDGQLVAIVMPGMVDAGTRVVTVTEKRKAR